MSRRCTACGQALRRAGRFCPHCGAPQTAPPTPQPDAPSRASSERPAEHQHTRSKWRGHLYRAVGVVLLIAAVGIWADTRRSIARPGRGPDWTIGLFGVFAAGVGAWLFKRGKQHIAPTAEELMAADPRPPVVYLRSFDDDKVGGTQHYGRGSVLAVSSEEEQVSAVMDDFGPFVAIGRPGDRMPELGAARIYVPDEAWRRKVLELMGRAKLVVFRAGASDGLWWEVAQAASRLSPTQLLFLVPFAGDEYHAFRTRAEQVLGHRLPDHPGKVKHAGSLHGFIHFDARWQPAFATFTSKLFRTSSLSPVSSMLKRAMEPVYAAHGIPWRDAGINWWMAYLTFLFSLAGLGLIVLLLAFALGWIET